MPLTWLHISDFHIRNRDTYELDIVLRALVHSIKRYREQEDRTPDLIFATGDIAFSGKADEYEIASRFFDELLEAAALDRRNLFVVPGNHDVDRRWGVQLSRTLNSRGDADEYFAPGTPKLHLRHKLGAFHQWHEGYFRSIRQISEDTTCGPVELVSVRDQRVGILPINTALFCQDDTDHDKLFVGRRCLDPALKKLSELDVNIKIALLHHPVEWLSSLERQNIRSGLIDYVDVVLHGHLHEGGIAGVSLGNVRNLVCGAGATYQTRERPNTAYYGGFDGRQIRVFPIHYVDQPREVWTLDAGLFPNEPQHEMVFPIPRDPDFRSFRIPIRDTRLHGHAELQKVTSVGEIAASESRPLGKVANPAPTTRRSGRKRSS